MMLFELSALALAPLPKDLSSSPTSDAEEIALGMAGFQPKERQSNRQNNRSNRNENRTDNRSDRVDTRTDVRHDRIDDWNDYYRHHRVGYRVRTLPAGYRRVVVGPNTYYYSSGVYYNRVGPDYVVVASPVGARVATLPTGYRVVPVRGVNYYYVNNTYYRLDAATRNYVVVANPL